MSLEGDSVDPNGEIGDYTSWWARVKYPNELGCEDLPVTKLSVEYTSKKGNLRRKPFKPSHFYDFDKYQWYVALSSKDMPDNNEEPFYALIGRLAGKWS